MMDPTGTHDEAAATRTVRIVAPAILVVLTVVAAAGCDQLNRPMNNTGGSSSSSSGGSPVTPEDGGRTGSDASAPPFSAQPGDVQL